MLLFDPKTHTYEFRTLNANSIFCDFQSAVTGMAKMYKTNILTFLN